MQRVLMVFPTSWDERQLANCRAAWSSEFEPLWATPRDSDDYRFDFDILAWIQETADSWGGRIDGVASASDYPGATAAAAIAQRLGLPGSKAEEVLLTSHKYTSRLAQRESVPEATAGFELLDALRRPGPFEQIPEMDFPRFVKPVKGAFSVMARSVSSRAELEAFLDDPRTQEYARDYVLMFNRLLAAYTGCHVDGGHFLAEEQLTGSLVTVEGWACDGEVELLGIVDSVLHPGTRSFVRFDYPSRLPTDVQERMRSIARRVIRRLGLDRALFNIEMIHDESSGRITIIEVNPRAAGQFADLYQKVDGTNSYEILLRLATGEKPRVEQSKGIYRCASSCPLRVFDPVRVLAAPDEERLREAEASHPGTMIWSEARVGQELSDFVTGEDGSSYRYGIVNLGGADLAEVEARLTEVQGLLGWGFESI
jgi:biotin carboxylase